MNKTYEKPEVEIISFEVDETLANSMPGGAMGTVSNPFDEE